MGDTTMIPRTNDLTWFFAFVLASATVGPLLFGYHLVLESSVPDILPSTDRTI